MNFLSEFLICELSFESCCACLAIIYQTISQSSNEYDTFFQNVEQLLTYLNSLKPHMQLLTSNFNKGDLLVVGLMILTQSREAT